MALFFPPNVYSFFSYLAALARISSTTLTTNGEIRHPSLAADVGESFSCFTVKGVVNCTSFTDALY